MAVDVGSDLPSGPSPADFNRAAADFEATVNKSSQSITTWTQQLDLSVNSINRFSTAVDLAAKALGGIQGSGMSSPAAAMSPAATQAVSQAMGSAMGNLMSSPMMRGMQSAEGAWGGAKQVFKSPFGSIGSTAEGVGRMGAGMEGMGAAMGGKAGGVLAGAGGALAKAPGPIGVAIQIIQGIWATLKLIEAVQSQMQKENRSTLMSGPAQAGAAYGSGPKAIEDLNRSIKEQSRLNKFTSREVQEGMMRDIMSTQKDMGNMTSFLQPRSRGGVGRPSNMGGLAGTLNTQSPGNVEDLQATGFSNEKIAGTLAGNTNTFGNFSAGGAQNAFAESASELKELKITSGALNISQSTYLKMQEDLISTNREQIRSVKDVRDEMVLFGKEVEATLLSVGDFSKALRGPASQTLDNTLAQLHLFGEEQAKAFEKDKSAEGIKAAAMIRQAKMMENPFEAGALSQEAFRVAGQGPGGGKRLSGALEARREGISAMVGAKSAGAQALAVNLPGMAGMDASFGSVGKDRSGIAAQGMAAEREAQAAAGRPAMLQKMEESIDTYNKNAHSLMDAMLEPLHQGVDGMKVALSNAASAIEVFAAGTTRAGQRIQ